MRRVPGDLRHRHGALPVVIWTCTRVVIVTEPPATPNQASSETAIPGRPANLAILRLRPSGTKSWGRFSTARCRTSPAPPWSSTPRDTLSGAPSCFDETVAEIAGAFERLADASVSRPGHLPVHRGSAGGRGPAVRRQDAGATWAARGRAGPAQGRRIRPGRRSGPVLQGRSAHTFHRHQLPARRRQQAAPADGVLLFSGFNGHRFSAIEEERGR